LCIVFCSSFAAPAHAELKSVHVYVALADNQHQGIVPVPARLGDGEDARNNLYWGALYGVKGFLLRSKAWTLVSTTNGPSRHVLERCIFYNKALNVRLVAEAYRGRAIKACVRDFLVAVGGGDGAAHLVVYAGHNGLMEFTLPWTPLPKHAASCDAMVLACFSKAYFAPRLKRLKARALLLTTGRMAPEAYTLDAAVRAWATGGPARTLHEQAARAYHRYQQCGLRAARNLFHALER
jgi:hypothetical protein